MVGTAHTFLFDDLVGFTALAELEGDDRALEVALEDVAGFPSVRVGIHTGPALPSGGDWYGQTVNVAARLCAVTPDGEVMVSEATQGAAGRLAGIDYGERELHWLRNVSEPISTYLVSARADQRAGRGWPPRCVLRKPVSTLRATA